MRSFAGLLALGWTAVEAAQDEPVTKVVELLKELKSKTKQDAEDEQKAYDKFACWCENTTQRKAKLILQSKKDIQRLGTAVLKGKSKVAQLSAEIAQLTKDIAQNEDDQQKATQMRQKENADFSQQKAEMEQTLNALERAIAVLSGAGTADKVSFLEAKDTIKAALHLSNLQKKELSLVSQFLSGNEKYNPQSATIQGILKDMYNTFAETLETATVTEMDSQSAFEELMDLKIKDLKAMQKSKARKEVQKAETEKILAEDSQELEDTTQTMNDAAEFFDATAKQCKEKSDEWDVRKEMRAEELDGINKALDILTSDSARKLFTDAIKPGRETFFIQTDSEHKNIVRAYQALKKSATETKNLRLATLAVELRKSGHFVDVIKKIDDMIQTLADEGAKDKADKDTCTEKMHRNSEKKALEEHHIMRNELKIEKLNAKIAKLDKKIALTVEEIAQTKDLLKQMKQQRQEENTAYKKARADDEAAVDLLEKATAALSSYFVNNDISPDMGKEGGPQALMQQEPEFEVSEDQAPETKFSGKDDNKQQSQGIVNLMTMITNDLRNEIKNGIANEESAEALYQKTKAQVEKELQALKDKKTNLESTKADTESAKADENTAMDENHEDLDAVEEKIATIKEGCDWLLENFDKRAAMRAAEDSGLKEAKSILAGMQATSLISKSTKFDDKVFQNLSFSTTSFLSRK